MTGDMLLNFYRDRQLPQADIRDYLQDYLRTLIYRNVHRIWNRSGLFNNINIVIDGDRVSFVDHNGISPGDEGYLPPQGLDNSGHEVVLNEDDCANIPFEHEEDVTYHFGMYYVEVPAYTSDTYLGMNPRPPMEAEYHYLKEEVGYLDNPTSVSNDGTKLVINLNSVFEEGVDHSGRTVIIYLVRSKSIISSVAFYSGTSLYNSLTGVNYVEISYDLSVDDYPLGQGTNEASNPIRTSSEYYKAFVPGVCIRRNTDLSLDDECIYIGSVINDESSDSEVQYILDLQHDFTLDGGYDGPDGFGSGREIYVDHGSIKAIVTSEASRCGDINFAAFSVENGLGTSGISYLSESVQSSETKLTLADFVGLHSYHGMGETIAWNSTQTVTVTPGTFYITLEVDPTADYTTLYEYRVFVRLTFDDEYEDYNGLYVITYSDGGNPPTLIVFKIGYSIQVLFPEGCISAEAEILWPHSAVGTGLCFNGMHPIFPGIQNTLPPASFIGFGEYNAFQYQSQRIPFVAVTDSAAGFLLFNGGTTGSLIFGINANGSIDTYFDKSSSGAGPNEGIINSYVDIDSGNDLMCLYAYNDLDNYGFCFWKPIDMNPYMAVHYALIDEYYFGGYYGSLFVSRLPYEEDNYPHFIGVRDECNVISPPNFITPWESNLIGILNWFPSTDTFTGIQISQIWDGSTVPIIRKARVDYNFLALGNDDHSYGDNMVGTAVRSGCFSIAGNIDLLSLVDEYTNQYSFYSVYDEAGSDIAKLGHMFRYSHYNIAGVPVEYTFNLLSYAPPCSGAYGDTHNSMYDRTGVFTFYGGITDWMTKVVRNDIPEVTDVGYVLPYIMNSIFEDKGSNKFFIWSTGLSSDKMCLDDDGNLVIRGKYLRYIDSINYHYSIKVCHCFHQSCELFPSDDVASILSSPALNYIYPKSINSNIVVHSILDDIPDGSLLVDFKLNASRFDNNNSISAIVYRFDRVSGEVVNLFESNVDTDTADGSRVEYDSIPNVDPSTLLMNRDSYSYFIRVSVTSDNVSSSHARFYDCYVKYHG